MIYSLGDVNKVREYLKELTNQVIGFMYEIILEGSIITKHFKSKFLNVKENSCFSVNVA